MTNRTNLASCAENWTTFGFAARMGWSAACSCATRATVSPNTTGNFRSRIPTGFQPSAQGCEERVTLGKQGRNSPTPTGLRRIRLVGCNPVGVGIFSGRAPRVARSSQPWAGGRNPFGIELSSWGPVRCIAKPSFLMVSKSPVRCAYAGGPAASQCPQTAGPESPEFPPRRDRGSSRPPSR